MMTGTRVVIVDDHPFVREGLRHLLGGSHEFELTGEATELRTAQEVIERDLPDVAIIDLGLGAEDGSDLVRWLRQHHPRVRVLVLTMQDEALNAERLLRLGASGYVMKNAAGTDFLVALRKVAKGQRHVSAAVAERLVSSMASGKSRASTAEDPVSTLTLREREVFELMGEGASTQEIAARLSMSIKTVDAHRRHMCKRLNLRSTNELLRYAASYRISTKR